MRRLIFLILVATSLTAGCTTLDRHLGRGLIYQGEAKEKAASTEADIRTLTARFAQLPLPEWKPLGTSGLLRYRLQFVDGADLIHLRCMEYPPSGDHWDWHVPRIQPEDITPRSLLPEGSGSGVVYHSTLDSTECVRDKTKYFLLVVANDSSHMARINSRRTSSMYGCKGVDGNYSSFIDSYGPDHACVDGHSINVYLSAADNTADPVSAGFISPPADWTYLGRSDKSTVLLSFEVSDDEQDVRVADDPSKSGRGYLADIQFRNIGATPIVIDFVVVPEGFAVPDDYTRHIGGGSVTVAAGATARITRLSAGPRASIYHKLHESLLE